MGKYNQQYFTQTLTLPINNDTIIGANVAHLNGLIKAISVLLPDLDGSNGTLSILGRRGEAIFASGNLTKSIRTVIVRDANNHPLSIPVSLDDLPVLKFKSNSTGDATGVLSIDGDDSNPADGDTVSIVGPTDSKVYRFKNTTAQANDIKIVPHVAATAVLTSDETQVTDGKKVTAGSVEYTFKTALTDGIVANEVLIGSDADDSLLNLKKAINAEAGGGTNYGSATVVNPDVSCGAVTAHAVTLTAKVAGAAGNSLAKAEDDDHLDFDGAGATFTGGADSGFETLENLELAIGDAGTGDGSDYHAGTVAHADVTASRTNGDLTVTAAEAVEAGEDVATTEVSSVLEWAAPTLVSGGETAEREIVVDLYIDRGSE